MGLSNKLHWLGEAGPIWKAPLFWCALLAILVSRWLILPTSFWEFDEALFAQAILLYEPLAHHPPPPGYPVFIGLAKLLNFIIRDPFSSLVALSLIGTLVGFCALTAAFRNFSGSVHTGIIGALLFYFSPVMLIHSTLPISDPLALGFLSLTLWAGSSLPMKGHMQSGHVRWLLFGALAALTIGCRPQFSIAILPLLVCVLGMTRNTLRGALILLSFTVTCVIWLVPLILSTGGVAGFIGFESGQASYLAAHDADISRSNQSPAQIILRFVAHPWGPKWISGPILLLSAVGIWAGFIKRYSAVLPLVFASVPYLVFALLMMDPADGARYSLPFVLAMSFLVAVGLMMVSSAATIAIAPAGCLLFIAASFYYTSALLIDRSRTLSPVARAAAYARQSLPKNSVILVELPLWPQGTYLLPQFRVRRIEEGWREFFSRKDPVYILADGGSDEPGAVTFSWRSSDAYGKLTRNHYRVVSLVPVPAADRFEPLAGVYPSERTADGLQWRWLGRQAAIRLPDVDATSIRVELTLPPRAPLEKNSVELFLNGRLASVVVVSREGSKEITIPIGDGANVLAFRPKAAYVPAEVPGSGNRDPRTLSVQLTDVEQVH